MAYTSKTAFKIPRRKLNPDGVNTETITTNRTLTYADSQFQAITNSTGGSLNVTLPDEEDGAFFGYVIKPDHLRKYQLITLLHPELLL